MCWSEGWHRSCVHLQLANECVFNVQIRSDVGTPQSVNQFGTPALGIATPGNCRSVLVVLIADI